MALRIESINESGIIIGVNNNEIIFNGNIDSPTPGTFLEPFFYKLHNEILKNKMKKINIDVTELDFLNSSGIREFIDWLLKVEILPDENKYHVNFLYTNEKPWQNMSFTTLKMLCPEFVKLTEKKHTIRLSK